MDMAAENRRIARDFRRLDQLREQAKHAQARADAAAAQAAKLAERLDLAEGTDDVHRGVPLRVNLRVGKGPSHSIEGRTHCEIKAAGIGFTRSQLTGGREAVIAQELGYASPQMVSLTICWWRDEISDTIRRRIEDTGHRTSRLDAYGKMHALSFVSLDDALHAAKEWVACGVIPDRDAYAQIPENQRRKTRPSRKVSGWAA
jgi:hypothetical protein